MVEREDKVIDMQRKQRRIAAAGGLEPQSREAAVIRHESRDAALEWWQAGNRRAGEVGQQRPQQCESLVHTLRSTAIVGGFHVEGMDRIGGDV